MKVAHAVADPVRREILEMLREASLTAGEIADQFPISRPAVSRHLRILRECGLVSEAPSTNDGRSRVYHLDARPLQELDRWLAGFRFSWSQALDALGTEVYRTQRDRRSARIDNHQEKRSSA
ncbi:metalloregulator ArsR/SmtB family transcription factor [Lolliginicoccus levis]|uniref:metalloregulator ArsR/SmtB family transcription factor n=1 Tax=Lolliginicoccus levis TaxID=2919542 RepID=UPI00241E7AB5|nr:metalloregulator ArsR/SmtB family transcription factor [Lolliginicoccus levis]